MSPLDTPGGTSEFCHLCRIPSTEFAPKPNLSLEMPVGAG